jgi:hypothetical protein
LEVVAKLSLAIEKVGFVACQFALWVILFYKENLASLMVNTTRKIFTLAKFYSHPEHENSLEV